MASEPSTTIKGSAPIMLTDTKVAAIKATGSGREEYRDLKVTGLRLRVGPNGKSWIVRARAGGKIVNKKLGAYPGMGLATARTSAEKLLGAMARTGDPDAVDRTFGQVAELWIEKAKGKNKGWKLQERRLELHVLPKWRDRKIASIRRAEVRELIEGLTGETLPNAVLALVRPIFRFALSRDWIDGSPVEGIEKPKAEVSRDRVLAMDELAEVWHAADVLGFPFVKVLLLTGQRRTEVASMRWENVDLDAGIWTLESGDNKSRRAHLVPLVPKVVEVLKGIPRWGPFVFTSDGETFSSGYAKMKLRFDGFIAGATGEAKPWVFHDLRRSMATHLVRLGVLEEVVGKVLNHASQGVTAKVYALHRYEPEKRNALECWATEVGRAVRERAEEEANRRG